MSKLGLEILGDVRSWSLQLDPVESRRLEGEKQVIGVVALEEKEGDGEGGETRPAFEDKEGFFSG